VAVFEQLFQALFSYRPVVFQQGDFRFDITTASFVAAGIVALIMGAAIFTYRTVGVNGRPRDRVVLTVLRMAALALVLFCLFRPTLVVKAAIPQQNVVAIVDEGVYQELNRLVGSVGEREFLGRDAEECTEIAAGILVLGINGEMIGRKVLLHTLDHFRRTAHGILVEIQTHFAFASA
jgi:hypothetical protein